MAVKKKFTNTQQKKYTSPMSDRYKKTSTTKRPTTKSGWGPATVLRGTTKAK